MFFRKQFKANGRRDAPRYSRKSVFNELGYSPLPLIPVAMRDDESLSFPETSTFLVAFAELPFNEKRYAIFWESARGLNVIFVTSTLGKTSLRGVPKIVRRIFPFILDSLKQGTKARAEIT